LKQNNRSVAAFQKIDCHEQTTLWLRTTNHNGSSPFVVKLQDTIVGMIGLTYYAIGYENDKYVLRGPTEVPEERRQTLRIDPSCVFF
jgi:hypothetical protein